MNEPSNAPEIEFGGQEFWTKYDAFCLPENLERLARVDPDYDTVVGEMHRITVAAHRCSAIHRLTRPERGWEYHLAWLALKDAPIQRVDGNIFTYMRPCDVIVVEYGWDRDVYITHSPISEHVCGYLLSGRWEPMVGLFLPLFEKSTINLAIELRLAQNVRDALEEAAEKVGIAADE